MFKKNYKKVVIPALALTMMVSSVALSAEAIYNKQLTATYGRIKFNYEGKDVTKQIESKYGTPAFTADDRAYAPVRAIADLLGTDIDYDSRTHTVKITDTKVESHKKELDSKNKEIANKDKKIEELEKEIKKLKDGTVDKADLKSVETSLNKKYGEYEKVEFNIVLKESKDTISIDINTDLKNIRDEQNWIRMRNSDKRSLIEDIVAEVRKAFPSTAITGNIYDSYSRKNLYTFSQSKTGSLSVSDRDYDDRDDKGNYGSLDSYVRGEFTDYGIKNASIYRRNPGKSNETFEISFSSTYERDWDDLVYKDYREVESLLDDIADEIEYYYNYDYRYDDIYIEIYMGNDMVGKYNTKRGFEE